MDLDEIIKKLEAYVNWTKESLDKEANTWVVLRAREEYNDDLKKIKFALAKSKYEDMSNADRETLAYQDLEYRAFINKKNEDSAEYYTSDYKKTQKEKLVEVLRSLLSFNKNRISQEI